MTAAWTYYVSSHSLLTELRGLTQSYPFSNYCVDEAKRRVYADPASNRSWNLCWLVLKKIKDEYVALCDARGECEANACSGLIRYYAHYQASQPAAWGRRAPTAEQVEQLTAVFVTEWKGALEQILRYWELPPTQ